MSRNRDDAGQFTEEVGLADVLAVFDEVDGPVVTTGDVADATGCSSDSARRKTAGRIVYWRLDATDSNPVNPDDPIFTDRPTFDSGEGNLSERVDELLYGNEV